MRYRVTKAYVNARVRDQFGQWVLLGFSRDALLPEGTHEDDVAKLLRKTMVEEVDLAPAVEPEPAEAEEPEEPAEEPKATKRTATKAAS